MSSEVLSSPPQPDPWRYYPRGGLDEFFDARGNIRPLYRVFLPLLQGRLNQWDRRKHIADQIFHHRGVTFALGSSAERIERPIPFDIVPRILSHAHWQHLERGLAQRLVALNLLVGDIYGDQRILQAGVIPRDFVYSSPLLQPRMMGVAVPQNRWVSVAGIDIVRTGEDEYVVLEDNVRSPSGVSYVLENRLVSSSIWPQVMRSVSMHSIVEYPQRLLETLLGLSPGAWVVLTPGVYNSAYFEHSLLASQMGLDLVEGRDLVVYRNRIHVKTTQGLKPIDGIYRRVDEDFLDPLVFRADSLIGVPGLGNVLMHGALALVNAVGCGIADDKGMYRFIPDAIRYYLGEEPILSNIPTYLPVFDRERDYIFSHWDELVIKPVAESGGKGLAFGRDMSQEEREQWKEMICRQPRQFIAQPVITFSTAPVYHQGHFEARYVDFRPFCLLGKDPWILPGGLTRVSGSSQSLVVNSSQGGAIKDTWVLRE
ncbi:circularly permuted type 2 ATP-grasp protein [Sulfobacillus thermosulfidooxidans]|uniref:circularly permuted type 2 ATP-grasp protein n=1 Tax=Sulfobacillus thermosulfidooxidans TaxID=28034 RepID=UPI0006B52ECD|nr:circularly permuted type 2 ATP-grasp protein [Sulfobacillus thermosulfidooxidans]